MTRCRGSSRWLQSSIRKLNVHSRSSATTKRIWTILSPTALGHHRLGPRRQGDSTVVRSGAASPQVGSPAMLFQGVPRLTAARDKQEGESATIHSHRPQRLTFPLSFIQEIASAVKGSFGPRHDRPRLVGVSLRSSRCPFFSSGEPPAHPLLHQLPWSPGRPVLRPTNQS